MEALKNQNLIVAAKRFASPTERVWLALRYVDGLTDAEIAAATDRPEREVAARLAQLETRLKRAA